MCLLLGHSIVRNVTFGDTLMNYSQVVLLKVCKIYEWIFYAMLPILQSTSCHSQLIYLF
ncbi:hypothetical protein E2C01_016468 [Portunus trituberculatus]|uniref:Uncharacterized protein n=1 Tax=Portunus trituberculatus TaxID=210409 RepID=A0A5B7DP43_PORTR|nr:hypothetical protein [Portunus trituberculatus]